MSKLPCLVIALAVPISLTACSGAPPWTVSRSPGEITLRWWSDEVADAQAAGTAGAYCAQLGKAAETVGLERDGSASIGRYRCI